MRHMNAAQRTNLIGLPRYNTQSAQVDESTEEKRSWSFRRLVDVGVIEMADSQPKPPGFYVNATTIFGFIIIAATIAGLFFYAMHVARESGYEKGKNEAEKKELERRMTQTEADARRAKELILLENKTEQHNANTK